MKSEFHKYVTTAAVVQLLRTSKAAGDCDQVALCVAAVGGDAAAWALCCDVIVQAKLETIRELQPVQL